MSMLLLPQTAAAAQRVVLLCFGSPVLSSRSYVPRHIVSPSFYVVVPAVVLFLLFVAFCLPPLLWWGTTFFVCLFVYCVFSIRFVFSSVSFDFSVFRRVPECACRACRIQYDDIFFFSHLLLSNQGFRGHTKVLEPYSSRKIRKNIPVPGIDEKSAGKHDASHLKIHETRKAQT